jgi:AraC-like DNA-binding protein
MASEPVNEGAVVSARGVLSPWVDGYLGYRAEGFEPGIHVGMPSHQLTFIISLGDPVDIVGMPGHRQAPGAFQAFVGGLHAGPAHISHDGNQHGVAVQLTPLGARALFGMPAGELASQVVDLEDLLGPGARSLPDRLASLPTWPDRFAVLDDVLGATVLERSRRRVAGSPPQEVALAFHRLVASGGAVGVGELADEVGWSRRHLGDRFRAEIGLAPKVTGRVVRFHRAKQLLGRATRPGLADIAAAVGYADQAHFTREFRELAGTTPTRWLAEDLPSVQDLDDLDAGC